MVLKTFVLVKILFDLTYAKESAWQKTMLWEDDPCEVIVLQNIIQNIFKIKKKTFDSLYRIDYRIATIRYSLSLFYHKRH